jgi:hypothetical protein
MKISLLIQSMLAISLGAVFSIAAADTAPLTAPAWKEGGNYKFGAIVNYEGYVFKAESGSAHKRPNVAADDGWDKLNACDDKSKGAIPCDPVDQPAAAPAAADAKK